MFSKALGLLNLFCEHLKSLYFISINTRDVLEVTQRTLLHNLFNFLEIFRLIRLLTLSQNILEYQFFPEKVT